MESNTKYKWHFVGSLIVVSIITILGFVCLSSSYHHRLETIAELQKQDCKRIEYILQSQSLGKRTLSVELEHLSGVFSEHEERMQGLMEMEFEKLQNDFNFVSLWAGIITIVFLIFSIYSIFKTDEMLKKSERVFEEIQSQSLQINNYTKRIKQKYKNELEDLSKKSDDYIKELNNKILLLNERLASIDSTIKNVKENVQTDDTVQTSSDDIDTQEPQQEA